MISRTIGAGGDYATIQAALTAVHDGGAGASDHWTLTLIANVTETGAAGGINLNGYTVTITVGDGDWHAGMPASGCQVSVGADVTPDFGINDNGRMVVERLRFKKTAANVGAASATALCQVYGNAGNYCMFTIRNCIFDGAGLSGNQANDGLRVGNANSDRLRISNCKAWDCTRWGIAVNRTSTAPGDWRGLKFVENCTVYNCVTGIYAESDDTAPSYFDVAIRNCTSIDNTTDWSLPDAGSGGSINVLNNCADSDDTIAGTTFFGAGSATDCIANIVSADEFVSLDDTSVDFLRLPYGALNATATTTALSGKAPFDVTFAGNASYAFSGQLYDGGIIPLYVYQDITDLLYGGYEDAYPIGCHNCRVVQ